MVLIMLTICIKDQKAENVDEMLARERAENFAANPEPNIFYNEGGSTDLGERPKVFSPESILGFSGLSPIKSILDGDYKIPSGMFGLAGLAYDYFKNKEARNEYDAKMAAALKKEQAVEPTAMIGQGAMMMAEGGETDRKGYIFGGTTRSTRDIDDIDDNESIQLLGFGPKMSGRNYKALFNNKVAEGDLAGTDNDEDRAPENIVARRTRTAPEDFRPGIDQEFTYFETPLNPSAAEVMGTSSSRRPEIPPIRFTNTTSYGIP